MESILRRACSAIIRIRLTWSSAANLSFSSLSLGLEYPYDGCTFCSPLKRHGVGR